MNPRNRRSGFFGYSTGPSSYSYYPAYFSTPFYTSNPSTGYTGYGSSYSRTNPGYSSYTQGKDYTQSRIPWETTRDPPTTSYQGGRKNSDYVLGLRRKSGEVPAMAKEASVTRELFSEKATSKEPTPSRYRETPAREDTQPIPPPRSKKWGSYSSLAQPSAPPSSSSSSFLTDLVSTASNRFSKATQSLYQKSRGALGILRSSSLYDLRGSITNLRGSTADLRGSTSNVRGSISNLKGSTSELRSSRTDITDRQMETPKRTRARIRRQTTQVSELDLSRARCWQGSNRDLRDSSTRELSTETVQLPSDLGYSSQRGSRRTSTCDRESEENISCSDNIDYKKLWEDSQAENTRLRLEMVAIREELKDTRRRLEEALKGATERGGSLEKVEMEEKLKRMETEIQELRSLREENEELSTQNSSLSQAISKMSANVRKTTRV